MVAFTIRIFKGDHLQDAHSESVYVNQFIVILFIHFWSHKLWCALSGTRKKNKQIKCIIKLIYFADKYMSKRTNNHIKRKHAYKFIAWTKTKGFHAIIYTPTQ